MSLSFSAALLAGGRSSRMGTDKALLPVAGFDHLWQRQLDVLRQLDPVHLLWSGPARPGLPADVILVADKVQAAGPLAGICACLDALEGDLLLVLAVDLPCMTAPFLRRLIDHGTPGCGVVAERGFFEPLAAVYPKAALGLALNHLAARRLALQDFVAACHRDGLVNIFPLAKSHAPFFRNLNTQNDLNDLRG